MILYETESPESPIHALVSIRDKTCTFTLSKQWDWEKAQLEIIPALAAIKDSDQWSNLVADFRNLRFEERAMGTAFVILMACLLELADENCAMISIRFKYLHQLNAISVSSGYIFQLCFCLDFEDDPIALPESEVALVELPPLELDLFKSVDETYLSA